MNSNQITGTAMICGIEVELVSEVDFTVVDDSFDHEFGTEHCSHNEVKEVLDLELDASPREWIEVELAERGVTNRNRRWLKRCRQWERKIRREIGAKDPETFWPDDVLNEAADNWESPEPDYD